VSAGVDGTRGPSVDRSQTEGRTRNRRRRTQHGRFRWSRTNHRGVAGRAEKRGQTDVGQVRHAEWSDAHETCANTWSVESENGNAARSV